MEKMTVVDPNGGDSMEYMLDEELDLLGELGDCHKTNLADIDVIARTTAKCHLFSGRMISMVSQGPMKGASRTEAEDTDSQEEESDLLHLGLDEEDMSTSDEESKTLHAIQSLDRILQRIDILQSHIRRRQELESGSDESQTEEHVEPEDCSGLDPDQAEIRCIIRAQHHIQCQITELLCRYENLRTMMRRLSQRWKCLERQILEIRGHNQVHLEWTQESANDLSNCQHRHRSLAAVKLTKKMALLVTKTNMSSGFRYSRRYVRRALLSRHINDFHYEIEELKLLSEDICCKIDQRLEKIKIKANKMGLLNSPSPRRSSVVTEVNEVFSVQRNTNPKVMVK
ncbi:uncharacterized protein LOC108039378 [Drosophila rhopaloa]|uniref:Uncharacterized protein LOC108039378 n=1 Tax=Drosophila rhopaloa TaxID=1041015 RepID=A0A6P4E1T4_DRORH|nr:uncharacterized protein LOC108039378 [Drosophila rhopaloa]